MKKVLRMIAPLLFLGLMTACNNAPKKEKVIISKMPDGSEDFIDFYNRFHSDSLFQVSRIQFPLEGKPSSATPLEDSTKAFYWEKSKWRMHKRPPLEKQGIEQKWTDWGALKTEKLIIDGMFYIERRFSLQENSWFLIYYADTQEFSKGGLENAAKSKLDKAEEPAEPSLNVGQ